MMSPIFKLFSSPSSSPSSPPSSLSQTTTSKQNRNHHHHRSTTSSSSSLSLSLSRLLPLFLFHTALVFQHFQVIHGSPTDKLGKPSSSSASSASVTTSAKSASCHYTVVINEFDTSKCSSMPPSVQADGAAVDHNSRTNDKAMMKDRSAASSSYSGYGGKSSVESQLENVEHSLLEEMVKSREINSTLHRHTAMLSSAQRTLEAYKANFTSVFRAMVNMERRLQHQRRINRSLNKKLSNVILDVVEVNNVLTRKIPTGSAKKAASKSYSVESVGKVRSCVGIADSTKVYKDCAAVYDHGHHRSDVYFIKPLYSACPIPVWCDMDSPKAGWLVIQRRQDGSVDFKRKWNEYRDGFGDVIGEHWLGNDNIFLLTNQDRYQLRIDLWDFSGNRVFALYSNFKIEGERDRYRLHVSGFSGSAKDSLHRHNNKPFSTSDRDHDNRRDASCAIEWLAGWWFDKCWYALLNGPYQNQSSVQFKGIAWKSWKTDQLRGSEMKIRPLYNKRR